jgi:PAS domain-containing protein
VSTMKQDDYEAPVIMAKRMVALGTTGVSLISVTAIFLLFMWRVNHPVKQIIAATRRIAKGERARIEVTGKDEIAQVAHSVNAMEEELQADKEQIHSVMRKLTEYKKALESSTDIIYAISNDYTYLFVNQTFLDYLKMERTQVEGRRVEEVEGQNVFETILKPNLKALPFWRGLYHRNLLFLSQGGKLPPDDFLRSHKGGGIPDFGNGLRGPGYHRSQSRGSGLGGNPGEVPAGHRVFK